jgi:cyclopropane fatty-acyl-phospholipid synthase-like methyltransferase
VTKYVALEPNALMHPHIHRIAGEAGFSVSDGTLLILSYTADNLSAIRSALEDAKSPNGQVDTIVSILSLCTIPNAELVTSKMIRELLKPGGEMLFYEHVLSPRRDVAFWQRLWSWIWQYPFGGCRLDRPTHLWMQRIKDYGEDGKSQSRNYREMWKESKLWGKEGEPADHLFWHQVGRFVKHD